MESVNLKVLLLLPSRLSEHKLVNQLKVRNLHDTSDVSQVKFNHTLLLRSLGLS
jgi:hypothetical protein